MILKSEAKLGK